MVLKDMHCSRCGRPQEAMVYPDQRVTILDCVPCKRRSRHFSYCTGGTKSRYRYHDWSGIDPSDGDVEYIGVRSGFPDPSAVDTPDEAASATPCKDISTGEAYHDHPRFSRDGVEDRRKRRKDKRRIKRVGPKLYSRLSDGQ